MDIGRDDERDRPAGGPVGPPSGARGGEPERSPCRVLVVEDNADSAQFLASLLEIWGHPVCVAHEGSEALGLAEAFRPEVVLMDLQLPDMDGAEVARRLRGRPGGDRPVLVALSGYDPDNPRGPDPGEFDHRLAKPVDIDALQELLARPSRAGS